MGFLFFLFFFCLVLGRGGVVGATFIGFFKFFLAVLWEAQKRSRQEHTWCRTGLAPFSGGVVERIQR